jgi:hypothetical protein
MAKAFPYLLPYGQGDIFKCWKKQWLKQKKEGVYMMHYPDTKERLKRMMFKV